MRCRSFVVEVRARFDPNLVADHLELARGIGGQSIGEALARIGIGRAQRGHHSPEACVLLHGATRNDDIGGRLVLVGDDARDGLGVSDARWRR